ncbi:MAG: penicillin-binding protein 2 [Candidatus Berkelbacteria bacterium]|nr:MAG: penicillin-binding protein 2 [Candidatus Berkelbacteria bacterium]QQG51493.1 MAG: penicillin-binding protein 2 [Candidatus Berkelbacteria bacterium]
MASLNASSGSNGRLIVIFGLIFFLTGSIIFRLFEKQVIEHDDFVKAAETQSTATTAITAPRGKIYAKDKDGQLYPLAISQWQYLLEVSPRQVKDKQTLAALLAKDLPELKEEDIFSKINNDKLYVPALIKGLDEIKAQSITKQNYKGVFVKPVLARVYPEGDKIAPQALGFVGADGSGKYGIEAVHDDLLRGRGGSTKAKRDSLGRLIDILSTEKSEAGRDLVLTIDYNLQFIVETKLREALDKYKADGGSVIVMNPVDGGIMAIAGSPSYDPNAFSTLKGDEQYKFLTPAASNIYEPGSVFKPLTMASAIDAKLVEPETTNTFGKSVVVKDREIFNAENKVYGKETMTQVLENSDNVAMVWISSLLGADKEREYFEKFGFGTKSGVDLVGEQSGRLPEKKEWNDVLRSTAAFGQGVSVTTVQLAAAYSALVNKGNLVTPHLVEKSVLNEKAENLKHETRGQVISAETSAKIRQMMVSVVENGHGKRAKVEGVSVGGKTGTAEVPDPHGGYYTDRHIGTFAGFFPAENPKVVMVVRLDNPKTVEFAESSAAPTFGEIANWIVNYLQLRS